MKNPICINIKKLPKGGYLATSDRFSNIVASGKTIADALAALKKRIEQILLKSSVDFV